MPDYNESIPLISGLYVLSDLHLAPPGEHCVFAAHQRLVSLLRYITNEPVPQCVVLNGDVFDFLLIDGYETLSLRLAASRMSKILEALDEEPDTHNVSAALRDLTKAGHTLHCLAGNHDPELHLYSVQKVLHDRLGATLLAQTDDGVWQLRVGERLVLGAHGHDHRPDPFNSIARVRMLDALAKGDREVPLPPGSRLVLDAINSYRCARDAQGNLRFPFIDLLPSDLAVATAVSILDPRLAGERLFDSLGVGSGALIRRLRQQLRPHQLLGPQHGSATEKYEGTLEVQFWLDEFVEPLAIAVSQGAPTEQGQNLLVQQLSDYFESPPALAPAHALARPAQAPLLNGGGVPQWLLFKALAHFVEKGRDAFRPHVNDALSLRSIELWPHADVIVTGHTHAAKSLARLGHRTQTYLNTGTWLDLTPMPTDTSREGLQAWLDLMRSNQVPRWQGCPVAHIDQQGARLLHWNGLAFTDWKDGLPSGVD